MSALRMTLVGLLVVTLFNYVAADYNQSEYRNIVYYDTSNDDAIRLSPPQLIVRSGFSYELYYVVADDGYITPLYRIVNPKVNRTNLRKTPIIIYHGANIDASCYLIASSKQHFPEAFPRLPSDGPIKSSNRSLGFLLPNHGYDVWLVGVRGSNKDAQRWTNNTAIQQAVRDGNYTVLADNSLYDYAKTSRYWQYGQDDVVSFEIKYQIDKVRNVTGSKEFYLYSYSLSTTTTLAFLSLNPDYAQDCRVYFQMAPAISASHFTSFDTLYFEKLCPLSPTRGAGFFPSFIIQPVLRELLIGVSVSPEVKYSLIYALTTQIFGPSPLFNTNLERNIISHIFQPVSFKTVQQYCQNSVDRQFNKFNYSVQGNPDYYGSPFAPPYPIRNLRVQRMVIVSGSTDGLASPETVDRLVATLNIPIIRIIAPQFNHLDMIAATKVAKYVSMPVLDTLDKFDS